MSGITILSCVIAFVFGVVPVLRMSGAADQGLIVRSGRATTRSGAWLRSGLMIGEVALATVLLSGSGLMVHTMLRLARTSPGFDPQNVQSVMFSLQGAAWPDEKKQTFLPDHRRTPARGARSRRRGDHVLAADPRLQLVECVHDRRHDGRALDSGRRVSECGNGAGDGRLFRNAQDPAAQRALLRRFGDTRFAARSPSSTAGSPRGIGRMATRSGSKSSRGMGMLPTDRGAPSLA
jgi:hypothetical protein